jgi:hypothetical protein
MIATGISDSAAVSDFLRNAISPGTAFAFRFVRPDASHRGLGVFLDALNSYASAMSFAFIVNAMLYALLIFGVMTVTSAVREEKNVER